MSIFWDFIDSLEPNREVRWSKEADEVSDFLKTRKEKNIAVMSNPDIEAYLAYDANKALLSGSSPTSWFEYPELVFKGEDFRKRLPEFIKKFKVELIVSSHRYLTEYPLVFNNGHFQVYEAKLDPNPPEFKLIKP